MFCCLPIRSSPNQYLFGQAKRNVVTASCCCEQVTKLGEDSPIEWLYTIYDKLRFTKVAQLFWTTLFHVKGYVLISAKNWASFWAILHKLIRSPWLWDAILNSVREERPLAPAVAKFEPPDDVNWATRYRSQWAHSSLPFSAFEICQSRRFYLRQLRMSVIYFKTFLCRGLVCISSSGADQGCQIFLGTWYQNRNKMHQMNRKCTKRS
jgi:hypothetical protein